MFIIFLEFTQKTHLGFIINLWVAVRFVSVQFIGKSVLRFPQYATADSAFQWSAANILREKIRNIMVYHPILRQQYRAWMVTGLPHIQTMPAIHHTVIIK